MSLWAFEVLTLQSSELQEQEARSPLVGRWEWWYAGAMVWAIVSLQNSYVETLMPKVMI